MRQQVIQQALKTWANNPDCDAFHTLDINANYDHYDQYDKQAPKRYAYYMNLSDHALERLIKDVEKAQALRVAH